MTPYQIKIASVTVSALSAAGICFFTAYLGGATAKVCAVGAALSLLKDLHSFTSTAPKDVAP